MSRIYTKFMEWLCDDDHAMGTFLVSGFMLLIGGGFWGVITGFRQASPEVQIILIMLTMGIMFGMVLFGIILLLLVVDLLILGICYYVTDKEKAPSNWLLQKITYSEGMLNRVDRNLKPGVWRSYHGPRDPYHPRVAIFFFGSTLFFISGLALTVPFQAILVAISVGAVYTLLWLARAVYRLNKKFIKHKNDPNAHTTKGEK